MIAFPTTPEAFIAYQEDGIGRKLDEYERELATVVVDFINGSYQEGVDGTENTVSIKYIQGFFRERGGEIDVKKLRIWKSICWWCDKAYMAGKEAKRV